MLNLQIKAFIAVLDEGSFEKAAYKLSITTSAISQRIKGLENQLGQILILRQSPCVPSQAGQQLLRSVRQMQLLESEAFASIQKEFKNHRISIAVNADSLATWFLPALATLHQQYDLQFEIHVEDQDHSLNLLRDGTVLGAITSDHKPVQGCSTKSLGTMHYLAVASPQFITKYFSNGLNNSSLSRAPMLVFNRKDELQHRFIRTITRAQISPPIHYIPSSTAFIEATTLGLGWAMAPDTMLQTALNNRTLSPLISDRTLKVPLFWQHWSIHTDTMSELTRIILASAAQGLRTLNK